MTETVTQNRYGIMISINVNVKIKKKKTSRMQRRWDSSTCACECDKHCEIYLLHATRLKLPQRLH